MILTYLCICKFAYFSFTTKLVACFQTKSKTNLQTNYNTNHTRQQFITINNKTMKTDAGHNLLLNGTGPYELSEIKSAEISILFNPVTENYMFLLSTEENGPIITHPNLEEGKRLFKEAFGMMLTFQSMMSMKEVQEICLSKSAIANTVKITRKPTDVGALVSRSKLKMDEIVKELNTVLA